MSETPTDAFQAAYCADRLKALGDPLRLRIVDLLRQGEMTVSDISEFLEVELVTASHHLQILKNSQLVAPRREGRFIYYRLPENVFPKNAQPQRVLNLGCCTIELPKTPGF